MNFVRLVCFSKDRAFQLQQHLETLFRFILQTPTSFLYDIHVLYTTSSELPHLETSYQRLRHQFPDVQFTKEKDFKTDLKTILNAQASQCHSPTHILFSVDDAFYYEPFDLKLALDFLTKDPANAAFHLKLHPGICYSHTGSAPILPLPAFTTAEGRKYLIFSPESGTGDWNYPWELCGSLYSAKFVREMIASIEAEFGSAGLSHPNLLEEKGNLVIKGSTYKYRCACPSRAILSVLTVNIVQSIFNNNVYEQAQGSIERLDRCLKLGMKLDAAYYRVQQYSSVHIGELSFVSDGSTNEGTSPLVSVLFPVKDCADFVDESIRSVLSQTYTNFELLAIDDGSVDNTMNILRSFAEIDERIRLFRHESPIGIASSLNEAIRHASGEYLMRMDGDDISLPHRLQRQVEFMEANKNISVLGSGIEIFRSRTSGNRKLTFYPSTPLNTRWSLYFGCCIAHPSVLIRRSSIEKLDGPYSESMEYAEDYDLWHKILQNVDSRIANLGEVLLLHRKHESNVTIKNRIVQQEISRRICSKAIENALGHQVQVSHVQALLDPAKSESIDDIVGAYRLVEELEMVHRTLEKSSEIDVQIVQRDAISRMGELAFHALQVDVREGGLLWGDWSTKNPTLSRQVFKKLLQ